MFRQILLALDDSLRADDLLNVAVRLTRHSDTSFIAVHVIAVDARASDAVAQSERFRERVAALRRQGANVVAVVDFGDVAELLARQAEQHDSDLVVVASRRNTALGLLWPPSVTTRLLAQTHRPIFVWPESETSGEDIAVDDEEGDVSEKAAVFQRAGAPIIVPLDGSALAEQALPYACAWARAFERPLTLLRVSPHVTLLGGGPYTYQWGREVEHLDAQEARDYLAAVRDRLRADPANAAIPDIETLVKIGVPTATILNTTSIYPPGSLIVMATHGRGGLAKLALGSVASGVLHNTSSPVVIVPAHLTATLAFDATTSTESTPTESTPA